jgi:hypothetical protein
VSDGALKEKRSVAEVAALPPPGHQADVIKAELRRQLDQARRVGRPDCRAIMSTVNRRARW